MAYSNFYGRFDVWLRQVGAALSALWHFLPSRIYLLVIAILNLGAWLEAWFIQHNLSGDSLVLHYNVDFGVDLVGSSVQIFWYPIFGLAILLINYLLAAAGYKSPAFRFCVHLLLVTAAIFTLILNLVLMFIYLVNFK